MKDRIPDPLSRPAIVLINAVIVAIFSAIGILVVGHWIFKMW